MMCAPARVRVLTTAHLLLSVCTVWTLDPLNDGTAGGHDVGTAGGEDMPPCPPPCTCSRLSFPHAPSPLLTVNCTSSRLEHSPPSLADAVQVLLLSHNRLLNTSSLPPLPSVRVLDLSYNHLKGLDSPLRLGLLTHLNLRDNVISELQSDSLEGVGRLEVLDLSNNIISTVHSHAFLGLGRLTVLRLAYNELRAVDGAWLEPLAALQELYLQGNFLAVIEGDTFRHTPGLIQLDLSDNSLNAVQEGGFTGLQQVKVLNLSDNLLTAVPTRELQRLASLDILLMDGIRVTALHEGDLEDMNVSSVSLSFLPELTVVEEGAFRRLGRLLTVQLHDNERLVFVHPLAFQHVPLLHRLLLHNNQLLTLSAGLRDSLPRLDELHVYGNPLHCDCNLWWLRTDMALARASLKLNHTLHSYIQGWDRLTCTFPGTGTHSDDDNNGVDATNNSNNNNNVGGDTATNINSSNNSLLATNKNKKQHNNSRVVADVPVHLLSPACPPTTLPLFRAAVTVAVGDDLRLVCQVVGVPQPTLSWSLPPPLTWSLTRSPDPSSGSSTYSSSSPSLDNFSGRSLHNSSGPSLDSSTDPSLVPSPGVRQAVVSLSHHNSTLTIRGVQQWHQGTYSCRADSVLGYDISSTAVTVANRPLHMQLAELADGQIKVTWLHPLPLEQISMFRVVFHRAGEDSEHLGNVTVTLPCDGERECRLAGLQPNTSYEVCMVYGHSYRVQCGHLTTRPTVPHPAPLTTPGGGSVTGHALTALCTPLLVLVTLCLLRLVRRRRRRLWRGRKDYDDTGGEEREMEKILLEPIDQRPPESPPCSPCTPRTALLIPSRI